jgi:hypothetical protein
VHRSLAADAQCEVAHIASRAAGRLGKISERNGGRGGERRTRGDSRQFTGSSAACCVPPAVRVIGRVTGVIVLLPRGGPCATPPHESVREYSPPRRAKLSAASAVPQHGTRAARLRTAARPRAAAAGSRSRRAL